MLQGLLAPPGAAEPRHQWAGTSWAPRGPRPAGNLERSLDWRSKRQVRALRVAVRGGLLVGRGGSSWSGSQSDRAAKTSRRARGNRGAVLTAGADEEGPLVKIWSTNNKPEFSCANLRFCGLSSSRI